MTALPWIIISIAGLMLVLGVVVIYMMKKGHYRHEADYRAFFLLGIVWFPLGLVLDLPFFYILGLVYLGVGLGNRNKWGKKAKPLTPIQIRVKKIAVAVGFIVLATGILAYMFLL